MSKDPGEARCGFGPLSSSGRWCVHASHGPDDGIWSNAPVPDCGTDAPSAWREWCERHHLSSSRQSRHCRVRGCLKIGFGDAGRDRRSHWCVGATGDGLAPMGRGCLNRALCLSASCVRSERTPSHIRHLRRARRCRHRRCTESYCHCGRCRTLFFCSIF